MAGALYVYTVPLLIAAVTATQVVAFGLLIASLRPKATAGAVSRRHGASSAMTVCT